MSGWFRICETKKRNKTKKTILSWLICVPLKLFDEKETRNPSFCSSHLIFSSFDSIPYQESLSIGLTRSLKIIVQSFPSWRRKKFVSQILKQNLNSCILFSIAFLLFYFDDKYNWRLIIRNKIFPFSWTQSNSFI